MTLTLVTPVALGGHAGLVRAAAGTAFPGAGAGNGIALQNDGRTFVEIVNGDTADHTATIVAQATGPDSLAVTNPTVVCTHLTSTRTLLGPFPPAVYNIPNGQTNAGCVEIDMDVITSVTYYAYRLP